ncbi:hypothetical protein M0812_26265 [Anaeramoeba flamelloides]|uniref:USP domain-containing protein n=1 Tax=Anaeramoeba flamelloides TaxID=1746091 RepID=A0AAV7YDM4_9EUKA|nr:hypothetical protein M0812_26265 [Anaeramoeba flamelloides]
MTEITLTEEITNKLDLNSSIGVVPLQGHNIPSYFKNVLFSVLHCEGILEYFLDKNTILNCVDEYSGEIRKNFASAFLDFFDAFWLDEHDSLNCLDLFRTLEKQKSKEINSDDSKSFLVWLINYLGSQFKTMREENRNENENENENENNNEQEKNNYQLSKENFKEYSSKLNSFVTLAFLTQIKEDLTCKFCNKTKNSFQFLPMINLQIPKFSKLDFRIIIIYDDETTFPMEHLFQFSKFPTYSEFINKISKQANLSENEIFLFEIAKSRIYREIKCDKDFSTVNSADKFLLIEHKQEKKKLKKEKNQQKYSFIQIINADRAKFKNIFKEKKIINSFFFLPFQIKKRLGFIPYQKIEDLIMKKIHLFILKEKIMELKKNHEMKTKNVNDNKIGKGEKKEKEKEKGREAERGKGKENEQGQEKENEKENEQGQEKGKEKEMG